MGTIIPYDKMNKVVEKNKNYDELLFTDSDLFGEIKETEGINISVFFLSAIIFTLTKFIYSKDVCITILTIKDGSLIKTILSKIINTNITVKRFYNEINSEINKFSDKEVVDFPVFQYYYQSMDDNDLNIPESDFTIVINEREIRFVYNSNLYSENLIKLFYNSLILILKKFLGDKNIHLRNIALMEFNIDHSFKTQEIQLVNELFEKIVTENKDKLALVATDRSLTFDELNNKANRIANHLIKRGLKIEDRVIINLFRGSNLIVAIIGVVKSGGTLIITDPEYPKERLSFIKKDTKAKFIINENNIKDFLNEIDDENPIVNLKPENMFSIVYTSGSTGVPKGVLVTNRSLVNIFNSFDFEKWKFLLNFNQTFMPFMEFLLLSLYYGGTIVLANNEELFNPVHLFKNHSFDVLAMTPSRLEEYIDNEEISSKLKDVKRIYLLGEKLRAILVEKLRKITHSEIYHLYGSSETGSTNIKLINDINTQNFGDISVGKPVFGVLEKVLDIDDNPLPSLIIGQLMVGGSISNGYWNDTKLTNEKFVEINAIPFFKTGDLGKYDENGNYSIIGRLDNQIKLRGQRIDPGEIENNVPDDIGVEKAIVTVNNENYNQVLALYFTTRSKTLKKDEIIKIKKGIKNHLLGKLPGFMVPQDYVYLEEFPKTSTGKVNVKDLKDYDGNIDEIVKPSNPLEQGIFDLSVELLGYDNFGVTNSLISIGFTSLSIIRLLNKILEKYQIELKLKDLINDNVSIKGLSKLIEKSTVVSYGKHELRDFYPLTSQQFGVYYDSSLNEDKIMYNIKRRCS
ncbi:MAG: peptide synthetase partial [Methanobrevibacter sp. CfCl-M3]